MRSKAQLHCLFCLSCFVYKCLRESLGEYITPLCWYLTVLLPVVCENSAHHHFIPIQVCFGDYLEA